MKPTKKSFNAKRITELLEQALASEIPISDQLQAVHGIDLPGSLTDPYLNPKQTVKLEEILVYQLVLKACSGNDKSIQEVLDRLVGKPAQFVESHTMQYNYLDFLNEIDGSDALPGSDRLIEAEVNDDEDKWIDELKKL